MLASIRYALRGIGRSPGFASLGILSLALGIGATTAIFSLVNGILLRTLPVRDPNRLVLFALSHPDKYAGSTIPAAIYRQIRDRNDALEGFAAVTGASMRLTGDGIAERVEGRAVSGNFFDTLGLHAPIGRVLTPEDERHRNSVCVIGYEFWLRRFAADPGALGHTLRINGRPYTIIGVTPKEFTGLYEGLRTDITIPLAESRGAVSTFGRLKRGETRAQAQGSLDALFHHVLGDARLASGFRSVEDTKVLLDPGARGFTFVIAKYERPLLLLMIVAGLVLSIACANMTNLFLARASGRANEIAVRLALGAGRPRLIRMLLVEPMLITMSGAALGLLLAYWADRALIALAPNPEGGRTFVLDVHPDGRVLLFTLGAAIVVAVISGLGPRFDRRGRARDWRPRRKFARRAVCR